MSEWHTAWYCVSCRGRLSYERKMSSHGRCPKCGYKGGRACTIVDTFERAYRLVDADDTRAWWQFWKPKPLRIEWREDES